MKARFLIAALVASLGAYGVISLLCAGEGDGRGEMPQIKVDETPLARSSGPVVTSYAEVLEEIRHSVVSVYSTKIVRLRGRGSPFNDPFFRRFFGPAPEQEERIQSGLGSGVIVSSNGYILTNNHVIEESDEIRVALPDGTEYDAQIVGADPRTDVAVVKIDAEGLPSATLADSDQLRVGDLVFAVGNPLGVGQTTTMGIVSATGRSNLQLLRDGYENFIQTDASINPGNSGGALVDALGRVVGINTAIISTSRGNIGIGFAIPVNLAANIMRSLIETGAVARGFLGVSLQDLDPDLAQEFDIDDGKGVLVVNVQEDSPADKAGLERGDVIVSVDGRPVDDSSALRLVISQKTPGTRVVVGYVRNGEAAEVEVVLGRLEEDTNFAGTASNELVDGVRIAGISRELREEYGLTDEARGVVVVEVEQGSRYASVLPVGTVIEQINRQPVTDVRSAREAIGHGRNILLLNIQGVYRYVAITLK